VARIRQKPDDTAIEWANLERWGAGKKETKKKGRPEVTEGEPALRIAAGNTAQRLQDIPVFGVHERKKRKKFQGERSEEKDGKGA